MTHKISNLSIKKAKLESSLNAAKIELQAKQSELRDLRSELAVVESNRETARSKRDAAKGNKDAMIGTAVGVGVAGVVFSIATLGIGTPVAVAATTACSVTAANYAEKEDKAKRDIERCNRRISNVEAEITTNRNHVASILQQNKSLQHTIQEHGHKCKEHQEHKKQTHNAIAFLQESRNFWGKFANALEQRSDKAEQLHHLLKMAEEKKERNFFKRRGGQTVVMSFIDAWERLREDVQSGSGFMYSMTFTCIQCKQTKTALPFIKNKQFTCGHCYRAIHYN